MGAKTPIGKLAELAMRSQEKYVAKTLKQIENMPSTPELEEFKRRLLQEYEYLMIDCTAILEAEKKYLNRYN